MTEQGADLLVKAIDVLIVSRIQNDDKNIDESKKLLKEAIMLIFEDTK